MILAFHVGFRAFDQLDNVLKFDMSGLEYSLVKNMVVVLFDVFLHNI